MTENHFWLHFSPFQIYTQLWFFFNQMLLAAILDDWKSLSIAFLAISDQYATFFFFFTKWLPAAILDDRKSLSMAFLAISDQCTTFIFFHKMAAGGHFGWPKITFYLFLAISDQYATFIFFHKITTGGHFGWPKITFNRISRHFRSIRNFFFTKWLPAASLDDRKSLLIALLAISE